MHERGSRIIRTRMRVYRFAALTVVAWALAACAITFGESPEPGDGSPENLRQRNLLYREEQDRLERLRQEFGPLGLER